MPSRIASRARIVIAVLAILLYGLVATLVPASAARSDLAFHPCHMAESAVYAGGGQTSGALARDDARAATHPSVGGHAFPHQGVNCLLACSLAVAPNPEPRRAERAGIRLGFVISPEIADGVSPDRPTRPPKTLPA
jgi:hypothetical protein